jgi:hypothetical protein
MISGKCDVLLRNVEGKRMLSEQQVRELASDGVAIETLARDSRTHEIDADYARALGEIAEDERKSIALAQYAFAVRGPACRSPPAFGVRGRMHSRANMDASPPNWKVHCLILSTVVLLGCSSRSPAPPPLALSTASATVPSASPTPRASGTRAEIEHLAKDSACADVRFRDRGRAPTGFMRGMAVMYAQAFCHRDRSHVRVVAQPSNGEERTDVLAWYHADFASAGMQNGTEVERLRHVYTLLIALGMQESSGRHCCGRDMSANFDTSDSAEAGAFQTSYGARRKSAELSNLFAAFRTGGPECFLETFRQGATCSANDARNWGTGDGTLFQQLSKDCPAFATEYAAVLIRVFGGSAGEFGPLRRKTVAIRPECDAMLLQVQQVIERDPSVCARL